MRSGATTRGLFSLLAGHAGSRMGRSPEAVGRGISECLRASNSVYRRLKMRASSGLKLRIEDVSLRGNYDRLHR